LLQPLREVKKEEEDKEEEEEEEVGLATTKEELNL
jgi:hypothetical protein